VGGAATESLSLSEALFAVAAELAHIRNDTRSLEEAVGHVLAFAAPDTVPRHLQQIDLLVQELDDLARFCGEAAVAVDRGIRFDATPALQVLRLRRLALALGQAGVGAEGAASGEVDLF
jgi:hypothetical protein